MSDKLVGSLLLLIAASVFSYYSVWIFVIPFLDEAHLLKQFFLDWEWAIRIPILLLVVGVTVILTFISVILIRAKSKKLKLN